MIPPTKYFFLLLLSATQPHIVHSQKDDHDCAMDPTRLGCAGFVLGDEMARGMVQDVCRERPEVNACTIQRHCAAIDSPPSFCTPFSLLSTACTDSPNLRGCRTYIPLCRPASVIQQCAKEPPVPGLPPTKTILTNLSKLCGLNPREGCTECTSPTHESCDPLLLYSKFCTEDPSLPPCSDFSAFCNTTNIPTLCPPPPQPPSISPQPAYRPYIHWTPPDYIIFQSMLVETPARLFATVILAFILAFLYEAQIAVRTTLEQKWAVYDRAAVGVPDSGRGGGTSEDEDDEPLLGGVGARQPNVWARVKRGVRGLSVATVRAFAAGVDGIVKVALVLLVITFNGWVIAGCVAGVTVGTFVFGGYSAARWGGVP